MISSKLNPNALPKQVGGLKAERTFHRVTFTPSSAKPGETLYVGVPRLTDNLVLVPGTLALRFDLAIQPSTADKRYTVNNVGRNLVSKMRIKFAGESLLDLNRYDLYTTYKDLWLTAFDRAQKIEQGIGSVILRKLRSDTNPAPTDSGGATAVADATRVRTAYGSKYVIPLDFEVITNHGVYYPRQLAELQFEVTLADTTNILQMDASGTALTGSIHPYSVTNLELQYETVYSEDLARSAGMEYSAGKAFLYDHVVMYKTFSFLDKTDEVINQSINLPRRSLTGLMLVFAKPYEAGKRDSEAFHNPNITNVGVNINGVPNKVYSQGIKPADVYREAMRKFGDQISPEEFFNDKYALWIDMRTINDEDLHGQGLRLVNTQDGITLEIKRTKNTSAGDSDKINCYIFVVSDAQLSVEMNQLKSVAY